MSVPNFIFGYILRAAKFCTWFILDFIRLIIVDNQPIINFIKLLINLVTMHYLSRFSGKLGGVSYKNS
jgi:hypothetical protein